MMADLAERVEDAAPGIRAVVGEDVVRLRVSSHSTGIERQTKERIDLPCF